jgi:hypothetical protein
MTDTYRLDGSHVTAQHHNKRVLRSLAKVGMQDTAYEGGKQHYRCVPDFDTVVLTVRKDNTLAIQCSPCQSRDRSVMSLDSVYHFERLRLN